MTGLLFAGSIYGREVWNERSSYLRVGGGVKLYWPTVGVIQPINKARVIQELELVSISNASYKPAFKFLGGTHLASIKYRTRLGQELLFAGKDYISHIEVPDEIIPTERIHFASNPIQILSNYKVPNSHHILHSIGTVITDANSIFDRSVALAIKFYWGRLNGVGFICNSNPRTDGDSHLCLRLSESLFGEPIGSFHFAPLESGDTRISDDYSDADNFRRKFYPIPYISLFFTGYFIAGMGWWWLNFRYSRSGRWRDWWFGLVALLIGGPIASVGLFLFLAGAF